METKERGLDWPAVGDIATGAIWRRWSRRLSAEDDCGCCSGNEDKPQGDKGEHGTGAGAKKPVAPGS